MRVGRLSGWLFSPTAFLFFRERLFARVEFALALVEFLFLLRLMFGVEALLHLAIDLGLTFRVGLLFLARRKGRQ